mmetsp:Transcript_17421/g.54765  ORF Transcript_17421/g.54765 Transcript_17421/m.54765 type:complete len:248 (+) Transcript_17421:74-817(+)
MAEEDDWKKTNVGAIGSDEDKAVRKAAASTEPAWASAGQEAGIKIWRIEHFTVQDVDPATYGKFHKGDSYIVLHTVEDPDSGKLKHTIHFFLGSETSIDEQGTAAYKTVELDDYFDGEPVQAREVMGEESQAFKDLFGGSIEYLEGGVDSGFKHVKPEGHDPRLFVARKVKGKTAVLQIPLKKSCIAPGDCYVLDAPDKIYVYDGEGASPFEKNAANDKAENIENERTGTAVATHDIDDGFWALLDN